MDVTRQRTGCLLGPLVLAVLVLVGCGGADDGAGGAAVTTSTAPDTTTSSLTTDTPTEEALPGAVVDVTFASGTVEGDRQAQVAVGEVVALRVSSDVADEVHVHGYDLFADVVPGEVTVLRFVADLPGVWEVELEGAGVELAQLEVS